MAGYTIRSLADLSTRARKYFTQSIGGAIASVWPNTFTVLAKVLALLDFEHEQRRAWLFRQIFASTADAVWLRRHGFELGLTPGAGTTAIGRLLVPAPPGLLVPSGLVFARADGFTYTSVARAIATGRGAVVYVEADAAGVAGNAAVDESLTLAPESAAPDGVGPGAVVIASEDGEGLTGGSDPEDLEVFRARVLARKRSPPQGGSAADYQAWAHAALPVVRDVYVDSFQNDARSVWLQFTVTDQPNGIPSAIQVGIVQAYLDDPVRRPVTARVFVTAPVPVALPVLIRGLAPDTPAIRAAVGVELAAAFIDRARPGMPSGDFVFSVSWLHEAISRATGEDRHRLAEPVGDQVYAAGRMPVLGPVSYAD